MDLGGREVGPSVARRRSTVNKDPAARCRWLIMGARGTPLPDLSRWVRSRPLGSKTAALAAGMTPAARATIPVLVAQRGCSLSPRIGRLFPILLFSASARSSLGVGDAAR